MTQKFFINCDSCDNVFVSRKETAQCSKCGYFTKGREIKKKKKEKKV